jgi:hypothetical protein
MAKATFNPPDVRRLFEQRLDSLDNDTKRCFTPIKDIQFAPFPAVLYAFSTVDYFSSCWKGWNDPGFGRKKKKRRNQTRLLVSKEDLEWMASVLSTSVEAAGSLMSARTHLRARALSDRGLADFARFAVGKG